MMTSPTEQAAAGNSAKVAQVVLLATALNCLGQILWFYSKCAADITFDGIDYVGIARHVATGEFRASLNAFRSPLISWLTAAFSLWQAHTPDHMLAVGRFVGIASFLACVLLTFVLTRQLWRSELAAAIASFWFSCGRGFTSTAVLGVGADFLLTCFVLIYFCLLLHCLRNDETRSWVWLGVVHAVAYLAKAIALPWLAISTVAAATLFSAGTWRRKFARMVAAGLAPLMVAGAWGTALQSKYGSLTLGSQFKTNLMQWTLKETWGSNPKQYSVLMDTTDSIDANMVDDPMPPGSSPWHYKLRMLSVAPSIVRAELKNLPMAVREVAVTFTVGGLLAFVLMVLALARNRSAYRVEFTFAMIVLVSAVCLLGAYCMLAFDGRYILPLVPLLIAVSVRALVTNGPDGNRLNSSPVVRRLAQVLVVAGIIFAGTYWASPFRTYSRDFQLSCVDAGRVLSTRLGSTIVTIGSGPFPEHGVGWEAGHIAGFHGNSRLVAALYKLPDAGRMDCLMSDLAKARASAVIVWGRPTDANYVNLCRRLGVGGTTIEDPQLGEVGKIFFEE